MFILSAAVLCMNVPGSGRMLADCMSDAGSSVTASPASTAAAKRAEVEQMGADRVIERGASLLDTLGRDSLDGRHRPGRR
jgi:hypothetical protein